MSVTCPSRAWGECLRGRVRQGGRGCHCWGRTKTSRTVLRVYSEPRAAPLRPRSLALCPVRAHALSPWVGSRGRRSVGLERCLLPWRSVFCSRLGVARSRRSA